MLKVVFYTRPGFLDHAFPLLEEMSRECEVHLIVEISPESNHPGPFPPPRYNLPSGTMPIESMPNWLPSRILTRLSGLAGFHLSVHNSRRAFHPENVFVCMKLASFIRSIGPDILHFDDATSRGASLPYLLPRLPLIMSIHDAITHFGERTGRWKIVRSIFLKRTQALIFHSRYGMMNFPKLSRIKKKQILEVIPLGIYDFFIKKWQKENENKSEFIESKEILFFGRISPYKGIDDLLEASLLVAHKMPGFRLTVAGSPITGYKISNINRFSNTAIFDFRLRYIPLEEMISLFKKSALIVLPYIESSQSGVVPTAFAFRRAIVSTTVGALPEQIENGVTGLLVPPRNIKALADAIVELLSNDALRSRMEKAIDNKVKTEFAWPRIAGMTIDLYKRVLMEKGNTKGNISVFS